jgi:hypothetical protein
MCEASHFILLDKLGLSSSQTIAIGNFVSKHYGDAFVIGKSPVFSNKPSSC